MRIVIAGGHGQVGLHLIAQLADRGDQPVGLIRNPEHEADIAARGGTGLVVDLENTTAESLGGHLSGADAVVFAAGAGAGSGAQRKRTVDLGAALTLIDACRQADVPRYVMISAAHADEFEPESDDVFQVYLRAKSEADRALRESDLEWTIVRPGRLTNEPATGRVELARDGGDGAIPRADVAALVVVCLHHPSTIGQQFTAIAGDVPLAAAIEGLVPRGS